jgi:GT2 family glycosyltransferase
MRLPHTRPRRNGDASRSGSSMLHSPRVGGELSDTVIVVDNDGPEVSRVRDLMAAQPISTTYPGWRPNLGGAGGFALGLLHTLAQGAD